MCSRVRAHQASDAGAGGSETRQRASDPRITNAWGAPARGMQAVATADEEPAGEVQRVTRDAPVPLIWRHMHLYHLFAFAALSIVGAPACKDVDGPWTECLSLS